MRGAISLMAVAASLMADVGGARVLEAPAAQCPTDFKAKVFFVPNQVELNDWSAEAIMGIVAQRIERCQPSSVTIAGYIDRDENAWVALARAETVKRELIERGVAPTLLKVEPRGATDFVKPPPNVQNRRVEIAFTYLI